MKAVAFVGPKGSGKDTCADIVKKTNKVHPKTLSFALPLKRICAAVFDVSMPLLSDPILKEKPFKEPITIHVKHLRAIKDGMLKYVDPHAEGTYYNPNKATDKIVGTVLKTPRQMLQLIGTEFIRGEIHPDWHCMAAFSEANLHTLMRNFRNTTVALTDTRFLNEYAFLCNKFGENIKFYYVERPKAEKALAKATHDSETEILKVKERLLADGGEVIKNKGSLEALTSKLENVTIPVSTGKEEEVEELSPGSRFRWKKVR